jgi:hypothetical protein
MDSYSTPKAAARRADICGHASADESHELVIVVLNELACAGNVRACQFCTVDYAGMYPVAAGA